MRLKHEAEALERRAQALEAQLHPARPYYPAPGVGRKVLRHWLWLSLAGACIWLSGVLFAIDLLT